MSNRFFDDDENREAFEHAWDREHRKDVRDEKARLEEERRKQQEKES